MSFIVYAVFIAAVCAADFFGRQKGRINAFVYFLPVLCACVLVALSELWPDRVTVARALLMLFGAAGGL